MKLFSSKRRMAVIGLTVGLIAGASGLAVAYFTTHVVRVLATRYTGTAVNVTITSIGAKYASPYSSPLVRSPGTRAIRRRGYAFNQFGNEIR